MDATATNDTPQMTIDQSLHKMSKTDKLNHQKSLLAFTLRGAWIDWCHQKSRGDRRRISSLWCCFIGWKTHHEKDNRRWASFHLVASRVLLKSMEIYWWRAIVAAMRMHRTTEGDERFAIQEIVTTPQFLSQHTGLAFWHISSKSNLLWTNLQLHFTLYRDDTKCLAL